MCGTCGCADTNNAVTMTNVEDGETKVLRHGGLHHQHDHSHEHPHEHAHEHPHTHDHHDHTHQHSNDASNQVIALEAAILSKNDTFAAQNRGWFEGRGVLALNLVSSPGAGKTTLLERTIKDFSGELDIAVIEGDQMTTNDAQRIREAGARAIQINTGAGCHLEADMVGEAAKQLSLKAGSILMIENVGNLVCPAMFDLGERMKIAVISTTEGEDKPIKYPHMFRAAELVIINKIDISQYVDFDEKKCREAILQVNPNATILKVSAKTGEGMQEWLSYLKVELDNLKVS